MSIRKGYVDTRDGQIHYRYCDAGKGEPIVFFHQTASSSASYERIMHLLEGEHPLFAFDTPGFGQSFSPPKAPTISYYAETLMEAMGNLDVRQCHTFGHHTGGAIAAEMAASFSERVKTLMVDGPVWVTEEERRHKLNTIIDPLILREDGSYLMKAWERVLKLDPNHPLELCHREVVDTLRAGGRYHEAYIAVYTQDSHAVYHKVRCPVLLLCGDNDVLYPAFTKLRSVYPDTRSVVLEGCGTYAVDNCADRIVWEIRKFIRDLNEA
jgi:pimeloyl-ACP methyl ester carboxylesterase